MGEEAIILAEPGFDEFVVQASPKLGRAAWLLLGDRHLAEDLVQETLVRMFLRWRQLREPEAASAYAHRTIVRLCRRHLARASTRIESHGDVPDRVDQSVSEVPFDDAVRAALLRLPTRQREAVVLRYGLDFSIESTARAMSCDPGTVKSQTSKGLAKLREELAVLGADRQGESA